MGSPTIVFGAGGIGTTSESFTFAWDNAEDVSTLLAKLTELRITQLDSAADYPPTHPWNTETLLGEAKAVAKGFAVDSKISITSPTGLALNDTTIPASLDKTLALLGTDKVHILYAYLPDPETPVAETAAAFHRQYEAGKFERLGLSNHVAKQVAAFLEACDAGGFVKPSVCQGHYNAVVRGAEAELLPLLRRHGIAYYAFSPLGGGFLTGKVTFAGRVGGGGGGRGGNNGDNSHGDGDAAASADSLHRTRWTGASRHPYYTDTFDREPLHAALRRLHAVCEQHGVSLTEVSLRWLMHHSALQEGDAIILGATKLVQLEANVKDCRKPPLPKELVDAVERMGSEVSEVVGSKDSWS